MVIYLALLIFGEPSWVTGMALSSDSQRKKGEKTEPLFYIKSGDFSLLNKIPFFNFLTKKRKKQGGRTALFCKKTKRKSERRMKNQQREEDLIWIDKLGKEE